MKYFIMVILMIVNTYAWEINTHRAIDREAFNTPTYLKTERSTLWI